VAAVRGTAHPLARRQFDRGRLNPEKQLSHIALTFRLSSAQQADLDELLREQQDASSSNYHKWLTPDQYASRFGMSASDVGKVSAWL
jgi:subtilase family serine protease